MTVTGWTYYNNPNYEDMFPVPVNEIQRALIPKVREIVASEIRKNEYRFTGSYHQNGDYGVPIIDNKYLYQCSQRIWGDIMVQAYPEEFDSNDEYAYVIWAWLPPEDKPWKTPVPKDYMKVNL